MGKRFLSALALAVLVTGTVFAPASAPAAGPAYPTTTVRILVGFPPGGSVDQMARMYAKRLSDATGGTFIVENRPGASGNIAADLVAKAKPDGYTLLVTSVVHSINASLFDKLPYDPVKDFSPVAPLALAPNGIAVNPSLPVNTLAELVAYAKAHPGQLAYAHAGVGTMMNLGMEMFASMAGIKLLQVPYNGTGPAISAVVGGQVPVLSSGFGSAEPFAKSGKLKMLAISTAQPSDMAPGVPTVAAAARLRGYEAVSWIGMFAPASTPNDVVQRLNTEVKKIQEAPDVRPFMQTQGLDPYYLTPGAFAGVVKTDVVRYGKIVHTMGIKSD